MVPTVNPEIPAKLHKNHQSTNNHVYIYSTLVPVCVCFIIIVAVWRVKRRNRIKKILVDSVVVVPNGNQRNLPQEAAFNTKKTKNQNHKKRKINAKSKKNNYSVSTITFPREPTYKSQENPSYLVPFTALPPNFDYSLKNVEVHSDFVVIKDLKILQTYWYEKKEYKKPTPYNCNFI